MFPHKSASAANSGISASSDCLDDAIAKNDPGFAAAALDSLTNASDPVRSRNVPEAALRRACRAVGRAMRQFRGVPSIQIRAASYVRAFLGNSWGNARANFVFECPVISELLLAGSATDDAGVASSVTGSLKDICVQACPALSGAARAIMHCDGVVLLDRAMRRHARSKTVASNCIFVLQCAYSTGEHCLAFRATAGCFPSTLRGVLRAHGDPLLAGYILELLIACGGPGSSNAALRACASLAREAGASAGLAWSAVRAMLRE